MDHGYGQERPVSCNNHSPCQVQPESETDWSFSLRIQHPFPVFYCFSSSFPWQLSFLSPRLFHILELELGQEPSLSSGSQESLPWVLQEGWVLGLQTWNSFLCQELLDEEIYNWNPRYIGPWRRICKLVLVLIFHFSRLHLHLKFLHPQVLHQTPTLHHLLLHHHQVLLLEMGWKSNLLKRLEGEFHQLSF